MRATLLALPGAMLLLSAVAGCGGEEIDEAGAADLWQRIQAEDYRGWARAAGWETRQPTVSAHGQMADIFVNATFATASQGPRITAWPPASVLVKDSYRGEELFLIAAMEKRDSGWFFSEWDAAGKVKFAGAPSVCLDCHEAAPDLVFSVALP